LVRTQVQRNDAVGGGRGHQENERKESSSFLKKRTKKLLLLRGMGFGVANAHAPE